MIEAIYTAQHSREPMLARERIEVRAGAGIVDDRNYGRDDHPGRNVTLIEGEELDRFSRGHGISLDDGATRRNIVTRGVRLNDLVGREFSIGDVRLRGVELCEPCSTLGRLLATETLSAAGVVKALVHRGGLRADVLSDGVIEVGMPLRPD